MPQGDDLRSGSDIKNEQTRCVHPRVRLTGVFFLLTDYLWCRISSGLISHERLEQDPVTGEYRSVYHLSLCRWFTISSTNNPETVPDPIANRTCFMPVCEMTKRCQENSISQSAAIAAHEDPDFDRRRRSVHIFLKTIASLQWAYTCPESCGAFPAIDMRCCDLFWQIFESMQGLNQMPPRRTNDIKMLAVSVMIWNCLRTWYIDGLGKEFAFDRPTEIAFYARYR